MVALNLNDIPAWAQLLAVLCLIVGVAIVAGAVILVVVLKRRKK